ncbi:hypothetical protein B0H19DRAFT_1293519 [Mycena capillaripes]|nr:hypothetical protein B0H19DRAFT_1293519 [Mycena capillaripes]
MCAALFHLSPLLLTSHPNTVTILCLTHTTLTHACAKRPVRHSYVLGTWNCWVGQCALTHPRDDLVLLAPEEALTCVRAHARAFRHSSRQILPTCDLLVPEDLSYGGADFTFDGRMFGYGRECGDHGQNTERDAEKATYDLGTEILVRRARGGPECVAEFHTAGSIPLQEKERRTSARLHPKSLPSGNPSAMASLSRTRI